MWIDPASPLRSRDKSWLLDLSNVQKMKSIVDIEIMSKIIANHPSVPAIDRCNIFVIYLQRVDRQLVTYHSQRETFSQREINDVGNV